MKSSFLSNEYIIGWVLLLTSYYLSSEDRILSANLFAFGAIITWSIDLVKKVKYVNKIRKEIKKKIKKDDEK